MFRAVENQLTDYAVWVSTFSLFFTTSLWMQKVQILPQNIFGIKWLWYIAEIVIFLFQVRIAVLHAMHIPYGEEVTWRAILDVGVAIICSTSHIFLRLLPTVSNVGENKLISIQTGAERKHKIPDFEQSSFISRITYSWINPVFLEAENIASLVSAQCRESGSRDFQKKYGSQGALSKLPPLPAKFRSEEEMLKPLKKAWNRHFDAEKVKANSSIYTSSATDLQTYKKLWQLFRVLSHLDGGREYLWVCIPLKISQDLLSIASHNSIHTVMLFLENKSQYSTVSEVLRGGVSLCCINIIIRLAQEVLFQFYLYHLYSSSLKVTIALKALILNSVLETPLGSVNSPSATLTSLKGKDKEKDGHTLKSGAEKENNSNREAVEALSLLTIDAERFGESMIFLHNVWSHPIVIFLALGNMYRTVGLIPTVVAFASLLLAIPLNKKSSQIVKFAKKNAQDVVLRFSDLMVALPMMRNVHAMSLQSAFLSRMHHHRTEESRAARGIINADAEATMITDVILISIYIVTYASYFLFGSNPVMAVSALLPVAASLSVVRFPIWASPNLVTQVVNGYDAITRIESFISRYSPLHSTGPDDSCSRPAAALKKRGSIKCSGMDFFWSRGARQFPVGEKKIESMPTSSPSPAVVASSDNAGSPVLSNLHIDVQPGEYIVIKGETGAGKTALLLGLLGELCALPSEKVLHLEKSNAHQSTEDVLSSSFHQRWCVGTVAYCAEVPWIADGTVRGNILMRANNPLCSIPVQESVNDDKDAVWKGDRDAFISEEEEIWYRAVLRACELDVDVQEMENSDLSEVGTAGSRLSGGQKARVALARALCYRMGESDIFILDNVLSALDFDLQQRIVHNVFHELILKRGKTLLVASSVFPSNLLVKAKVLIVQHGGKAEILTNLSSSPVDSTSPSELSSFQSPSQVLPSPEVLKIHTAKKLSSSVEEKKARSSLAPSDSPSVPVLFLLPHWSELKALLRYHFGRRTVLLVLGLFAVRQVFFSVADNWMGLWFIIQSRSLCSSEVEPSWGWTSMFYDLGGCTAVTTFIVTYAIVGAVACALSYWRTTYFFLSFKKAADSLHMTVVNTVFGAPSSYFDDSTAVDHVLQVLTKDQRVVDQMVAESVRLIITSVLQVSTVIAVNVFQYPLFILVVPIIIPVFWYLNAHFLRLSKPLRVLESHEKERATVSLKNAVAGAVTLRAFGAEARSAAAEDWCRAVDAATRVSHVALTNDRWVAFRLELLSLVMLALYQVFVVAAVLHEVIHKSVEKTNKPVSTTGSSALAGLGALALMNSTQQLGQLCRRLGMFQSQYVSVERLAQLDQDIRAITPNASTSSISGASSRVSGAISEDVVLSVKDLECRYQPHLPKVLSSFSLSLRSGECVGIIGRSGSGKSSLFNALLRVMDVVEGTVCLRSQTGTKELVDALTIPLYDLRRKFLHLVPQEPLIVEGTLRENLLLGAVESFSDEELMDTLLTVGISKKLEAGKSKEDASILDIHLTAGGKNLSAGQQQLLSVARALLHKPSVLLLDEVTSRIDEESEKLLVSVIQKKLASGCSAIIISHRQETLEALCHTAFIVRYGSIVGEVSPSQIGKAFDTFESLPESTASN